MFEACLALPRDPREARLIADNLEQLAAALSDAGRDWSELSGAADASGLFPRLVAHLKPGEMNPRQRLAAMHSATEVASVLRVLWPEQRRRLAEVEDERALAMS
ncbi:MAG: hypothetical protein M3336_03965 [Chloroflexota bacterium]|nr:hypothetical protein [Chloroflexota bacterium]